MISSQESQESKIRDFFKKVAPFSVIDRGIHFADGGHVTEASIAGGSVRCAVRDAQEDNFTVELTILSGHEVEAICSCSNAEEMEEQWCPHAIAAVWHSLHLGFFETSSGFPTAESQYRMSTSEPAEVAEVISQLVPSDSAAMPLATPEVLVRLDFGSDRLGVQICLDGVVHQPALFEGFQRRSPRTLDNVFLDLLEDDGSWDESRKIWYVNSSRGIERILGFACEYDHVVDAGDDSPITISSELLDAQLVITWLKSGAELEMYWILPDGSKQQRDHAVVGTGPFWTVLSGEVFQLSPSAARIASIFPSAGSIAIPRAQVAPILETVLQAELDPTLVEIRNPELQPDSEVKSPTPHIEFERRDKSSDHFASRGAIEIHAHLEFEYPTPPSNKNLVYFPNREEEKACVTLLSSLGFQYVAERKYYRIENDDALDLAFKGKKLFPENWSLSGLSTIVKSIRFSSLTLDLKFSHATQSKSSKSKKKEPLSGWFDCHVSLAQDNANIPLSSLFKRAQDESTRWLQLDNGVYSRVPGGSLGGLRTALGMLEPQYKLSNTIQKQVSTAQAISFSRIDEEGISVSLDQELKAIERKLRDFDRIDTIKPGRSFKGKLRSYQQDGLSWLWFLQSFQLGGILADEMGLGKTVQALALLDYTLAKRKKEKLPHKPSLVVAPTSVIVNWLYEAQRFSPKLKPLVLHGPKRKNYFAELGNYDVVITSYALLRLDRHELERHQFLYAILDEGQNIKNPNAATTKAAKTLQCENRLVMTGTPTENRPLELWSLMDFVMPGYLGSLEFFKTSIEKPILEQGTNTPVTRFLTAKTKLFILRRTKAEVEKDLPSKIESTLHVPMTSSQQDLYNQVLHEVRPKVMEAVRERGVGGASVSILAALLRLRQICNHPHSIESLAELGGFDSGKFLLLKELVTESLEAGHKILLFSQFRGMLSLIRGWLEEAGTSFLYLDGTTKNRQPLIDRFNADESVRLFLISLKAGGTGLNLTAADTVIIYDPWWNPAVEGQAVDRAHRIGQTKKVNVYRLVTENSIEQKIMSLKEKKAQIVDALINENGLSTLKLTKTDLESLFAVSELDPELQPTE